MGASVWNQGTPLTVNSDHTLIPQIFSVTVSKSLFALTEFEYVTGTNSLLVFVNGLARVPGVTMFEHSHTSFQLSPPAQAGDVVVAYGFVGITGEGGGGGGGGGEADSVSYQNVLYAEKEGALGTLDPNDFTDHTAELQFLLDECDPWTIIKLRCGATYNISQLSWNKKGVVITSEHPMPRNNLSTGSAFPRIRCLTNASYGIKIGAKENYAIGNVTTNMLRGSGISNVHLNGGSKVFTFGCLQTEGMQYGVFDRLTLGYVGTDADPSNAWYMRCFFDTQIERFLALQCRGGATKDVILMDDQYLDANGNCNMIKFHQPHIEDCTGSYVHSTTNSNMTGFWWLDGKHESANSAGTYTAHQRYVLDLNGGRVFIMRGSFEQYYPSRGYKGILRFNTGTGLVYQNNFFSSCGTASEFTEFLGMGGAAKDVSCRDNTQFGNVLPMTFNNGSAYPIAFERPRQLSSFSAVDGTAYGYARADLGFAGAWVSAHKLTTTPFDCFRPTGDSRNLEKSTYCRVDSVTQGGALLNLPLQRFTSAPYDVKINVLARRTGPTSVGAATLQFAGKSITNLAFADVYQLEKTSGGTGMSDISAAVTGITMVGNGTTVSCAKAAHGFNTGDRFFILNSTNFDTTSPATVEVTRTGADTFTFPHATSASTTGDARRCPWEVMTVTVPQADLVDLGYRLEDRFRLEYGSGNTMSIEISGMSVEAIP